MISILRAMYHNVSPMQLCLAFFSPFVLFLSLCFGLRCLSVVSGLGEASVLYQFLPGDIATLLLVRDPKSVFTPSPSLSPCAIWPCSITRDPCTVAIPCELVPTARFV